MNFEQDSIGFLKSFAKRCKGRPFSAEQVTLAAIKKGIAPADLRAWGKVFAIAAREGYIRRSNVAFKRSMGNGTLTLGWVGL
jgi:hypothetical protein